MHDKPTASEPFSAAYLNCADLVYGFSGMEVRLRWIVRYAPDRLIRRYVQDSLDRFDADLQRPAPPDRDEDDDA